MKGVKKIVIECKEIIVVDYSNCKEAEMIERLNHAKELLILESKPSLVLNIFERCYATPGFMRHAEVVYAEISKLIERHAITGLSETQKMILKGFNLLSNRNVVGFNSVDEAIDFLIEKKGGQTNDVG